MIELFEDLGTNLTQNQINQLKDLVQKHNQYSFALALLFHWFYKLNVESLKEILEDNNLNFILKIAEVVKNPKFGFFKHEYFLVFSDFIIIEDK